MVTHAYGLTLGSLVVVGIRCVSMEEIRSGELSTGDRDVLLGTRLEQALTVLGSILRDIAVNPSPMMDPAADYIALGPRPPADRSSIAKTGINGRSSDGHADGRTPPAQP